MTRPASIGEFSRATHLSVKTLHHYHEVGLLEPSEIDPGSGYRYYSHEQIPTAQVIRRLRGLEMPIAEVKAVLATPDPDRRYELIVEHLDRLEAELSRTRTAVGELRDLIQRPTTPNPIEHRTVAPTRAAGVHEVVDREDVLGWWQGALGELHAAVRAQGLTPTAASGGLYTSELLEQGRGQATVFVPVDGTARPIGRVAPLIVPGAELAVMRHHGPITNIDLTYGELGSYVIKHEISVQGPLRENYVYGLADSDDAEAWETEIGWPIFRSDAEPPSDSTLRHQERL